MEKLGELDADAFYRVDKTYNRAGAAFNEGISHGFNQLSTYSSANNPKAVAFLNALGYSSEGEFSSVYAASNLVMDSLLGVRYMGSWTQPAASNATGIAGSTIVSPIYVNPYALSLGLPCNSDRIAIRLPEGSNPFERQNDLFAQITGIDEPPYTDLQTAASTSDATQITWNVELPANTIGYVYVQTGVESNWSKSVSLLIDDQIIAQEGTRFSHNVRSFGSATDERTSHTIRVLPSAANVFLPSETTCAIYALNVEVFERGIEQLRAGEFVPQEFSDGHACGTYRAEEPIGLLFSIPYDKGWAVTVDGVKSDLSPAFGGGMSMLEVTEGTHEIEMTYRSPGLNAGITITGISAVLCAAIYLIKRRTS